MPLIERVTVIGAGTMGHGIAQVAAAAGCEVHLYDARAQAVDAALQRVRANLDKGLARGKVTPETRERTLTGLHAASTLDASVRAADLVI
ncbi:MAG TPA: 3-hydroxyacyl-CoA dehydrogenase NAD-binding domain-containing protein, partial [Longimicrobiaceae bacterium]|nr:3-hydroxyacyl-CoA dehydrogenase NAD-binding domain-containing protein [Longimicrobiaceae bacterium]